MAKGKKPGGGGGGGSNTVPQVTGLTANVMANQVSLSWNPVPGATTYWIRRGAYVPAIITGTTYIDTVTPGTYTYSIAAVVNSTLGQNSASVTVTVNT